ncbi:hypothetical protein IAT38_007846 [Cryptococcus sp. DSM 104549]
MELFNHDRMVAVYDDLAYYHAELFQLAHTWATSIAAYAKIAWEAAPSYIKAVQDALQDVASDAKSLTIILLTFMVVLLSYCLGSASRSNTLHTPPSSPAKSESSPSSATSSTRSQHRPEPRRSPSPDTPIPRDLAHLLSQLRGPLVAYDGPHPSEALSRLIHPLGSLWPKKYYDAFTRAMVEAGEAGEGGPGPVVRLGRGMVRRDLKDGVVFMVHQKMTVDELLGNKWRGVIWFDDE